MGKKQSEKPAAQSAGSTEIVERGPNGWFAPGNQIGKGFGGPQPGAGRKPIDQAEVKRLCEEMLAPAIDHTGKLIPGQAEPAVISIMKRMTLAAMGIIEASRESIKASELVISHIKGAPAKSVSMTIGGSARLYGVLAGFAQAAAAEAEAVKKLPPGGAGLTTNGVQIDELSADASDPAAPRE